MFFNVADNITHRMHRIMPESEYNFQTFYFRSFDNVIRYDILNSGVGC